MPYRFRFTFVSWRTLALALPLAASPLLSACGDDESVATTGAGGSGGGSTSSGACALEGARFEEGDPAGHPDPFGAKAAGQARAGRVDDMEGIAQPAHGRQPLQAGDVVLANDKIAVWIEAAGVSDSYGRFGGDVVAIDAIGEDGRPRGLSKFLETLLGLSVFAPDARSVTIVNDGSDGNAAVVRTVGPLAAMPFLAETFGAVFPDSYAGFEAMREFVLEPGAESVLIRTGVINAGPYDLDTGVDVATNDDFFGFFHSSQNDMVSPSNGFGEPTGDNAFVGFDSGPWGFAYLSARGGPLSSGIDVSGFQLLLGEGYKLPACTETIVEHVRLVGGGPHYDGLRQAVARTQGEEPWRAIDGTVEDAQGEPVAEAWVHVLGADGSYLSRTQTDEDGAFLVHAPGETVTVVPQKQGYPASNGAEVAAGEGAVDLTFGATGTIRVVATQEGESRRIPVRVQIIPAVALPPTPEAFGVLDELDGRLHQEFAVTGEATLTVPVGEHRVIVTRGYEWEMLDTTVDVGAGELVEIDAPLAHSVDTTGVLCADFHIHTNLSNDSLDPVEHKVKAAVADGLDIPVSSEHEWIADFGPVVRELGLEEWALGLASEELTTFTWGHFGVFPSVPQPGAYNNGAIDWLGKEPPEVFDMVHALPQDPVLIVNHPVGDTSFQAYFTAAELDPETGTSDDPQWSTNFDAVEVFNDGGYERRGKAAEAWYGLLNAGLRKPMVGSSDSHEVRDSPIGYPRTCLLLGTDDLLSIDEVDVADAVRAGRSTVSAGLFLTVEGPGGAAPGDTVPAASGATFSVTVETPGWLEADYLEVIVNGQIVETLDLLPAGAGPSNRYVNEIEVDLPAGGWVIFHAKGTGDLAPLHLGRPAFAVSNPIYVD